MLRAAGVNYDLRKVDKYGIYSRFDFKVPVGDHGDIYDRYMVRVLEMRESIHDFGAGTPGHSCRTCHGPKRRSCADSVRKPAKYMAASKARRANLAFTSSATAGRIRIATACVRRVSSI